MQHTSVERAIPSAHPGTQMTNNMTMSPVTQGYPRNQIHVS